LKKGGWGGFTGPQISVTLAPAFRAAVANANPIAPLESFEMKRTGSIYSRVGPAVMRICLPFKFIYAGIIYKNLQCRNPNIP
jgi:hypothetical protein